jgi:hypothetical protein
MLDERPDEFDERNLFLQAVLGLVSVSRRLDCALTTTPDAEPIPSDDPWLICVLGMVALRERVIAVLDGVPSTAGPTRELRHGPATLTEILR